ncbi:Npun_F5749 family FMN-dependent PPOX-type flavoprotein [Gloeocapsopsis dulcis]|uniref:Npun_F5749 family FMN-dependent PPOX-type flavoprotein n=1 Tax=Gloeocapsopsis dulcis TaxID=2859516 RepID=UPI0012DA4394|nr:Npun_F5749 family FMN-dependent PPOX-type flavoprotein [Gloeocapsopsis dulcis]WNN90492.1 pyridoxamine 5'-phosphate oxidase family protein [Gloeocapsopsis dulcis]
METIIVNPWRSPLARALHKNPQPSRYLQLATVRLDNRPANRTVVFRGFLEDTDQLKFIVDARTQKPEQIAHQPWAEACWYFIDTREQFRIGGYLNLVGEDHPDTTLQQARQNTWREISDAARLLFAFPHPGKPRADIGFDVPPPDATQPLPHFCLLILEPIEVDHLKLRGEPQNRYLYTRRSNRTWSTQEINP